MMQTKPLIWMIVLLALLMQAGCGFKLRGASGEGLSLPPVLIHEADTALTPALAQMLTQALRKAGVEVVGDRQRAGLVLGFSAERRDRRPQTLGSDGRVLEYALHYSVRLSVHDRDGQVHVSGQAFSAQRDYAYAETEVLAKGGEEQQLFEDMQREVVRSVMMRLRALSRELAGKAAEAAR